MLSSFVVRWKEKNRVVKDSNKDLFMFKRSLAPLAVYTVHIKVKKIKRIFGGRGQKKKRRMPKVMHSLSQERKMTRLKVALLATEIFTYILLFLTCKKG
jgi:hypothetical protein